MISDTEPRDIVESFTYFQDFLDNAGFGLDWDFNSMPNLGHDSIDHGGLHHGAQFIDGFRPTTDTEPLNPMPHRTESEQCESLPYARDSPGTSLRSVTKVF